MTELPALGYLSLADADRTLRSATTVVITVALLCLMTGCMTFGQPAPTTCDGISSELGGCDADRPAFSGETCEEIGREFGTQLDAKSLEIYNGPEDPEESKSVRAWHVTVTAISLANKRLRDLDIVGECDAGDFMAAAEPAFSEELVDKAGTYLFDNEPHTYAEWRAEVMKYLQVIDQVEDLPYGG